LNLDSYFKILTNNRLIFVTTALLTVLLAYQLSLLVWQIIPLPVETENTWFDQSSDNKAVVQSLSTRQKINQISNSHLFGRVITEKVVAAPVEVQDAPKSSLNYKVRGIYFSTDKALASVILQQNNKVTNFYRLGDEIASNIFIDRINEDHILISRQGRLEKLELEKPKAKLNVASRSTGNLTANNASLSSIRTLKSYKRRYADNPLALAKRFQAIPVSENGKNIGYKLKALRGERLLKKLNMQKDDVFVAINGIGLDKPFQALDALKSLTTADNVSLTVIRNGSRETLDFNLK